jgi:L-iditol 2-dehydrogenase
VASQVCVIETIPLAGHQLTASRLPANVSFAEGALLEPLSVVLHGISSARLTLGTPVLVCGAGPIGLLALASARASGAHPIVITDVEPSRLAFAKELVPACSTYQVDVKRSAEENAAAVRRLFGDGEYVQPRVALECTGVESSVCTAAFVVRRGGVLMVVGVGKAVLNNLPFMHLSLAEVYPLLEDVLYGREDELTWLTDRLAIHQPV